jgi:hypothetical protein
MAIPAKSCFEYHAVLYGDGDGTWRGTAHDDGSESLLGSGPAVVVSQGCVTLTRNSSQIGNPSPVSTASFDGGNALQAVLRDGDRLSCWRQATSEIGMSVTRADSLVLGLGTLGRVPGDGVTIDCDPRVKETELAREIRYIDRPGTRILWLDPDKPRELQAQLGELDGDFSGVKVLAIVVRTDDPAVRVELNRRTMERDRPTLGAMVFYNAPKRFSSVEQWLQYGRTLSTQRPRDLWLRIRSGDEERCVSQETSAIVGSWLAYVLRVYEPGTPGQLSQLGLVRAESAVTPAMLASSTASVARGLRLD